MVGSQLENYSNSNLSDHYTICISLYYEKVTKPPSKKKVNHFETIIPEYDLKAGDDEDWIRLNLLFDKVDWTSVMENLSPDESLSEFLRILQLHVSQVFKKHKDFDVENTTQTEGRFKNGNKIPKSIRNLMRNKANLSKSILRTKSVHKYLALKNKLETIELKLKKSYQE